MKPRILGFIARWWRTAGAVAMVVAIAWAVGSSYVTANRVDRDQQTRAYRQCVERNEGRRGLRVTFRKLEDEFQVDEPTRASITRILDQTLPIVRCDKP